MEGAEKADRRRRVGIVKGWKKGRDKLKSDQTEL